MPRLSEAALKRLDEARARSDELARELSDPATFDDARRAAELSREHAELADTVARYERYLRTFSYSFELGAFGLLRLGLRRIDRLRK